MKTRLLVALGVLALLLGAGLTGSAPAQAQPPIGPPEELLSALVAENPGSLISQHQPGGPVRFFRAGAGPEGTPAPEKQTPEQVATAFLHRFGPLFGAAQPERELTHSRTRAADRGRSFVRFQQTAEGVPVLGGEMVVQVSGGRVLSAHGRLMPQKPPSTVPTISADQAREVALASVGKSRPGLTLEASAPELRVYVPELLGLRAGPAQLAWMTEVTSPDTLSLRELVLVDAHTGKIALRFNQIATGLNRQIYSTTGTLLPGALVRSEGGPATGDPDADRLYDYLGDTYSFFWNQHGRDSLDGLGLPLVGTVHYNDFDLCPNAFWNGSQIVFCDGLVADDVVAHELTHGVTEHTSGLFYFYQSGAINESLSDIWAEFVDLSNGRGNDSDAIRWYVGEDTSLGYLRNMAHPTAFSDPDRMTSPYWVCDPYAYDGGGVHSNSGVLNKTAVLLTDGGSFNRVVIAPLGTQKVAAIFYELQVNLLTSASDYRDLYDLLPQACYNLVGTAGISADDCVQVERAVTATEMHLLPATCGQADAPLCPAGYECETLFSDDLEDPGKGYWETQIISGFSQSWFYPQNTHPYSGYDATYATSGTTNFWGDDPEWRSDSAIALTLDVALPAGRASYLHFRHAYQFEAYEYDFSRYDGAVVEISTDQGNTWQDAGPYFDHNGYNGVIASGFGNPLAGRSGFVGTSYGYTSSRLDLSALAGQSVRVRFRIGSDDTAGHWGWFIDDISLITVTGPTPATPPPTDTPAPDACSVSINAGAPFTNKAQVTLSLQAPQGATRMQLSNQDDFSQSAWELATATRDWVISIGGSQNAPRTVYARFGDNQGRVLATCSDDIMLDVTPPRGTLRLSHAPAGQVTVRIAVGDDLSGVEAVQIGNQPDLAGAPWLPYQDSILWQPEGTRVYVRLRDAAGNVSPIYWVSVGAEVHLPLLTH